MSVRMGLIGLGQICSAHLEGYARAGRKASIVAVCDSDATRAESVARDLGAQPYTDYGDLLGSGEVDAVDIMLPHHLHEEVVASAIGAGSHVLVEKPAAPTAEAVGQLEKAAIEAGVTLAVAENTRFVKAYAKVADLVQSGGLGQIEVVRTMICGNETTRLRIQDNWKGRKWGTLGGVIFDAGAHSFYLLEWLFGGAESLRAVATTRVQESEVEDFAVVIGRLRSKAEFITEYTFTAEIPWSERLEVYGSKGSVIVDQLADPVVKVFYGPADGEQGPWQPAWDGEGLDGVPYQPSQWKKLSIVEEVQDFVDAVSNGRSPAVRLAHVRAAMQTIEAAYQSAATDSAQVVLQQMGGDR